MSHRLQQISSSDLRVGMYIHKLGVPWFRHPFLKGSFLVSSAEEIQKIREAGIDSVWIDTSKSSWEEDEPADQVKTDEAVADTTPTESVASPSDNEVAKPAVPQCSMDEEVARARKICLSAKNQISNMLQDVRLGKAIDPHVTLGLVDEITSSIERQPSAIISVARLKTHDDYTYLHSVAVCALMIALAKQMGMDEAQVRLAGLGGLMHDLGKALMPLDILNKPGRLTAPEFDVMKRHPEEGAAILAASGAAPEVHDIALHHHEKINGMGYPYGLKGEEISLLARMAAICDVYDAVTSERAYKKPWAPAMTIREMASWEGHFDEKIFNAFVKSVGIYPVGSLVRLSSQLLAVVIEPSPVKLLSPTVKVFFSARSKEPVPVKTIDLASPSCRLSIVGPEDPAKWGFTNLDALWVK